MGRVEEARAMLAKQTKKSRVEEARQLLASTSAPAVTTPANVSTPKSDTVRAPVIETKGDREAARIKYSMRPEVRGAQIAAAEKELETAQGERKKELEQWRSDLLKGKDVDSWAESRKEREKYSENAQRIFDESAQKARDEGRYNPTLAGDMAVKEYLEKYDGWGKKAATDYFNYESDNEVAEYEKVIETPEFQSAAKAGALFVTKEEPNIATVKRADADEIISLINSEEYREKFDAAAGKSSSGFTAHALVERISALSDNEKNVLRSYYGQGDKKAVEEYFKLLERKLNARIQEAKNKENYKDAYKNPIVGTVKNVGASFGTVGSYIDAAGNVIRNAFSDDYVPVDTNSPLHRVSHLSKQTGAGVTDRAYDAAGGEEGWGDAARFLAGTGLSMANFASKLPLGATGAMFAMAADTAGQTAFDVLERGEDPGKAVLLGTVAGVTEALTERLPLDNLFGIAKGAGRKGLKNMVKSTLKQAGTEATEEMVSELVNTTMDIVVMGEKSEYNTLIKELESEGMSRAEAEKEAFFQLYGKNILAAGLGGAISGGVMGAGANVYSAVSGRNKTPVGFSKSDYSGKITNKTVRALDAIGKRIGAEITIGAPTGEGRANGYYDNGKIVIAQDAENPLEVVLCHEVTHHMQRTAPQEYEAFKNLALKLATEQSGENQQILIKRYQSRYGEALGRKFSEVEAIDEIAADFTKEIVGDVSLFSRLAEDNRNVAQRFIDSVREFIQKVKNTFPKNGESADRASVEKYGAKVSELETAVNLWETMLDKTTTAVADGTVQKNTAEAVGSDAKYSISPSFTREIDSWDGKSKKSFVVGRTSDVLKGLGVADRRIVWHGGKIAEVLRKHSNMSKEIIKQVPQIMEDPVIILKSQNSNSRITMFGEVRDSKGNLVLAVLELEPTARDGRILNMNVVASAYGKDSNPKGFVKNSELLYLDANKNRTKRWLQSVGLQLPSDTTSLGSIGTITYKDGKVNIQGVPYHQFMQGIYKNANTSANVNTKNSLKGFDYMSAAEEGDMAAPIDESEAPENEYARALKGRDVSDFAEQMNRFAEEENIKAEKFADEMVLDDIPKERVNPIEKGKKGYRWLKRQFSDSGEAVSRLGKTVGDKNLYAAYNHAKSAGNAAEYSIFEEMVNLDGERIGKSLMDIMKPIRSDRQKYHALQMYMYHLHNIDRMSIENNKYDKVDRAKEEFSAFLAMNPEFQTLSHEEIKEMAKSEGLKSNLARDYLYLDGEIGRAQNAKNKPVFQDENGRVVTAEQSEAAVNSLLRKYPELKEAAAPIYDYIDKLNEIRVQAGLMSAEDIKVLREKYPHYVPTFRQLMREELGRFEEGSREIGSTIGRAKGGFTRLIPIDQALSEMTRKVYRNAGKNEFGNRLSTLYGKMGASEFIYDINDLDPRSEDAELDLEEDEKKQNTFIFRDGGKRVEMQLSPEMYTAIEQGLFTQANEADALKALRKGNTLFKQLVTGWNPFFAVKNLVKDLKDGIMFSKNAKGFIKNYLPAYKEIAQNGEMWKKYKALGGLNSTRLDYLSETKRQIDGENLPQRIGRTITNLNLAIEQAPRLAEFMATMEGKEATRENFLEALYNAADVTVNFGRSGVTGKWLNTHFIPFYNPAMQGTSKAIRTFTETKDCRAWVALITKLCVMGIGSRVLNDLLYDKDEEYQDMKDRDKDNNFVIKLQDGTWLKLPRGRFQAAIGIVGDRAVSAIKGEKVDAGAAISGIYENIGPQSILAGPIKAVMDTDLRNEESRGRTWYGGDIESEYMQTKPVSERYDSDTDEISKALGKAFNLSPKKINYLMNQLSGVAGDIVLPLFTAGDVSNLVATNFTIDTRRSNKVNGEFYDTLRKAEQKKNSEKATAADKLVYKFLQKHSQTVSEYSASISKIEADDTVSKRERRELASAQAGLRTEVQKKVLGDVEAFRKTVEKNLGKYQGEDEAKREDFAYREASREVYGYEYAVRVAAGKNVYEEAKKRVEAGDISWDGFYDEYFGLADRRYKAIKKLVSKVTPKKFEAISRAMGKGTKQEKIEAIKGLGFTFAQASAIYKRYLKTE